MTDRLHSLNDSTQVPEEIACSQCGAKDALDTGWECTECGHDMQPELFPEHFKPGAMPAHEVIQ